MENPTKQNSDLAGRIGYLHRNDTHEKFMMFAGNSTPAHGVLPGSGYLSSKLRKEQAERR